MPRLPDETSLGARPTPRNRRGVTRYNPGQVEAAAGQLADTVFSLSQGFQEREDRQNYAKAKSLFAQEQIAASHEFDTDTDYKTFESRYAERMQKARSSASALITHSGLREQFMNDSDLDIQRGTFQVQRKALQREKEHGLSVLTTTLDANRETGLTTDDPEERASLLEANALAIDTAVENGYMDKLDATQLKKKTAVDYASAAIGMRDYDEQIERLSNPDDPMAKLLPTDTRHSMLEVAKARKEQKKRQALADLKALDNETLSDTILTFDQGQAVSSEELEAAKQSAQRLGRMEDLMIARASSQFILLPKDQRDAILPTLKGVEAAELRKGLDHANATIDREVDRDGYAFAVRQGVVDEVELDLTDSETIKARLQQVDYLSDHYGRSISPLTNDEADALVDSLVRMSPQDKTQLAVAFGPSEDIWRQLDKKNAGLFAMVGAIGDPDIMQTVFKGQQKIHEKLVAPIKQSDYLPVFDAYVGDVYGGKDRKANLNAAIAHYAATTESESFDSGDFEDSIEAVTGGIGKINGHKVELPRGISEDDFDDYIDNISPETVDAFGGVWSMSSKAAAAAIREGRIVSHQSNRYKAVVDGGVLLSPGGGDFVFSFDKELFDNDRRALLEARHKMIPLSRPR